MKTSSSVPRRRRPSFGPTCCRSEEAAKGLEALRRRDTRPALFAPVLAALVRNDEAMAAARETVATPFGVPREKLLYGPAWDPLRNDPRFQALVVKLNAVEDYQTARETLARMLKEEATKR